MLVRSAMVGLAVLALAGFQASAVVVNYGWEDGGTVLGTYSAPPVTCTNVSSSDGYPVNTGTHSLQLVSNGTGTAEAYVAWIKSLNAGDQVTVSFWVYDTTPSTNPSGRIWAGYDNDPNDVNGYAGSASGNSTYSGATPWSQLSYTWTMPSGDTGLVVQARVYGGAGATIWVDDLSVTAPDTATVIVPTPEPATIGLILIGVMAGIRRRR